MVSWALGTSLVSAWERRSWQGMERSMEGQGVRRAL